MDPSFFVIAGIVVFAGLLTFLLWWFSADQVTKRKLRGAPRKRIAEVVNGELVKIVGRLEFHAPPLAEPLTGRQCAFYETILEEKVRSGKNSHWRTRVKESDVREFVLVDDSGKAFVEVGQIRVAVVKDEHRSSGFLNDATPELEAYLARHGYESTGLLGFNRTFRVSQGVLEAGEQVAILGVARWDNDPTNTEDAGYRGGAKRLVIEAPADGTNLLASDDPSTLT